MTESGSEQDFTNARVRIARVIRGPDETGVVVFAIAKREGETFFEVDFEISENDVWVKILKFGVPDPSAELNIENFMREKKFSRAERDSAFRRIEAFFSGPEVADIFPFSMKKARYLGIKFPSR